MVLLVPISVVAATWQWNRWQERKAVNAAVAAETGLAPVPVATVLSPGQPVPPDQEWRPVTATGRYDVAGQVLLRKQPLQGRNGFWVVTPLRTDDGAVLPVVRGWLPATDRARDAVAVPAPPGGEVSVAGRLRVAPAAGPPPPSDLPAGQVNTLDVRSIAAGAPGYDAFIELTASTPPQTGEIVPLPAPQPEEGRHLGYVGQWALIGIASVVVFVVLVRREARYRREQEHAASGAPA